MKEITVKSTINNIETVTDFVEEFIAPLDCPMKPKMLISIAIDEILSNIMHYAYAPEIGDIIIGVDISETPLCVTITFTDNGKPYNPLDYASPDISLPAEDRDIGGLGIFITKNIIDEITYTYENNQNQLTLKKYL